jgi:hypothetical protein
LPHLQQTGLNVRAGEAVGAGKKLTTTTHDVVNYDFYGSENICIIDPEAPGLDPEFLAAPPVTLPPELVARYSLRAWAMYIFGLTEPEMFMCGQKAIL